MFSINNQLGGRKNKNKLKKKVRRKRKSRRQRSPLLKRKTYKTVSTIPKLRSSIILPPLRIVVLDNDECMGQFGYLSLFHQVPFNIKGEPVVNRSDVVKSVAKYILGNGSARPHIDKLLKYLKKLKKKGKIDAVVMYTSADNTSGYVHFLKDCLEKYAHSKGVYDDVIHYSSVRSVRANDGATKKDFKNVYLRQLEKRGIKGSFPRSSVHEATKNIIMFDDRPHNINKRGGTVIGVKPYCGTVPIENVLSLISNTPNYKNVEDVEDLIEEAKEDHKEFGKPHSVKQNKYKNDNEILRVIDIIKKRFDSKKSFDS